MFCKTFGVYVLYIYIYLSIYIHIYIYICKNVCVYIGGSGGASPVYPTPRNREIGFVSSSFSFRACRASGRGEAVRAHVERDPYRWASRVLGSTCVSVPVLSASIFCAQARGF